MLCALILRCGDVHVNPGPGPQETKKYKEFSMCHVNVRSLNLRFSAIETKLAPQYDIITLSETLLTRYTNSDCIKIQGYQQIFRRDRLDRGGGGVAAYVKNNIYAKVRDDLNIDSLEMLWLETNLDKSRFLLGVVYRPPDSPAAFWDDFQSAIDLAKLGGINDIIIAGDLNSDTVTNNGKKLKSFIERNNLYMHIHEPTRITPTSETCLDQIITSRLHIVKSVHVKPPVATNDHCTVGAVFNLKIQHDKAYQRHVWQYDKGDYAGLNHAIQNTDWGDCFEVADINTMCQRWTDKFLNLARQFVPNYIATIQPKDKPFYNNELRKQKRIVNRAFYRAKRTKLPHDWSSYKNLNMKYTQDVEQAKKNYETSLANSLVDKKCQQPRKWWYTVKQVLGYGPDSDIPNIVTDDDDIISDNVGKAEEFNKFFLSHSNIDDSQADVPNVTDECQSSLSSIQTTPDEVYELLKCIDPSKSTGPDNVNPRLLKETALSIAPSLSKLFNISLNRGEFPSNWKRANVIPIHKKNSRSKTDNYRPISLLSCVGKILEKIVFKYMFNYFRENFSQSVGLFISYHV